MGKTSLFKQEAFHGLTKWPLAEAEDVVAIANNCTKKIFMTDVITHLEASNQNWALEKHNYEETSRPVELFQITRCAVKVILHSIAGSWKIQFSFRGNARFSGYRTIQCLTYVKENNQNFSGM